MNYNTSDLYLAGYLMASGIPLKSNERESGTTIFYFEKTDKLLQLVEKYFNMQAVINPLHYGSALKILKNILYQKNYNHNYDYQQSGKGN
jgi:hypothetical protein